MGKTPSREGSKGPPGLVPARSVSAAGLRALGRRRLGGAETLGKRYVVALDAVDGLVWDCIFERNHDDVFS